VSIEAVQRNRRENSSGSSKKGLVDGRNAGDGVEVDDEEKAPGTVRGGRMALFYTKLGIPSDRVNCSPGTYGKKPVILQLSVEGKN